MTIIQKPSEKANDPQWYKDAVIYQIHIKSFFDANNDGIGDFEGLTAKLDYVKDLGVNTIWLLPFYPSPLRDDGYDIADYRDVNPTYGTLEDFKRFVDSAHERGLRVITELVINHTSDQHPWFQRARIAAAGSHERNFYVWSDTNEKYSGTRIIFSDTETSNWTWDEQAGSYYWHRFFSHQPDLNFENPEVLDQVIDIMYFWLDMGVDGLRLDAVPYLCEREGTNNENLPETHAILKKIRAALDAKYTDRLLLAEANQWPEDVMDYFGNGDECHMAFHFPLMPRMYMAVAQEDRHPITDIMSQTPDIPANCQWAIFLRNHDELTLEMVSDRERDYLWNFYANDKRARINFGIRRRLAPLMNNDRRKIELLNSLLMSMPGTPVLYYGDELGMGDNIYLGDRNGVRTPMQWSPDRNGGFSLSDPAQLYLPAIMDPVYGFQSINVETQKRVPYSLFNWMRGLILVARGTQVFGRGSLRFLTPDNRKVLAYLRELNDEHILCVVNLSHSAQAVELDLKEFNGFMPTEMLGKSEFPALGELPYLLTLAPYSFYWFTLTRKTGDIAHPLSYPEMKTLVIPQGWDSLFTGAAQSQLEKKILPGFLRTQRWYKGKNAGDTVIKILHAYAITHSYHLVWLQATHDNETHDYILALGISWETMEKETVLTPSSICRVRQSNRIGILSEVSGEEVFLSAMLTGLQAKKTYVSQHTRLTTYHEGLPEITNDMPIKSLGAEQTNSSAKVGDELIFKLIRHPQAGKNVEEEMGMFLTDISPFDRTPKLLGGWRIEGIDAPLTIGLVQQAVRNQGDGWQVTATYLDKLMADAHLPQGAETEHVEPYQYYMTLAEQLGKQTARMHSALAVIMNNHDFDPESVTPADRKIWLDSALTMAQKAFDNLQRALPELPETTQAMAKKLLASRADVERTFSATLPKTGIKTRVHGDYHLGQVLLADNDFYIIDFEGEPARALAEQRQKQSPYKDIAGMIRSFDYAASSVLKRQNLLTDTDTQQSTDLLARWRSAATEAFLHGYQSDAKELDVVQLRFYLLEKALYEIVYESQHRPDWVDIPLQGVLRILEETPL